MANTSALAKKLNLKDGFDLLRFALEWRKEQEGA